MKKNRMKKSEVSEMSCENTKSWQMLEYFSIFYSLICFMSKSYKNNCSIQ